MRLLPRYPFGTKSWNWFCELEMVLRSHTRSLKVKSSRGLEYVFERAGSTKPKQATECLLMRNDTRQIARAAQVVAVQDLGTRYAASSYFTDRSDLQDQCSRQDKEDLHLARSLPLTRVLSRSAASLARKESRERAPWSTIRWFFSNSHEVFRLTTRSETIVFKTMVAVIWCGHHQTAALSTQTLVPYTWAHNLRSMSMRSGA